MTRRFGLVTIFAWAAVVAGQTWSARPPRVIARSEPEYTAEAERAGVNATIVASLVVDERGTPRDIRIVRGAGFGLDESALGAIEKWRFEPGVKEGKPYAASTRIEIRLFTPDQAHRGQTARLDFGLADGVERPQLIAGEIPTNPDPLTDASLRVRFTVGRGGQPANFMVFETNNQAWADRALKAMALWRFQPALRDGRPEEVYGVLDLTVDSRAPADEPALRRVPVAIARAQAQDASLAAPVLLSPPAQAMFEGAPHPVICRWQASPGAESYLVEWDFMDRDVWHAESAGTPSGVAESGGTQTTLDFTGAALGRWRVWPVNRNGQLGNPSEWRTIRFQN